MYTNQYVRDCYGNGAIHCCDYIALHLLGCKGYVHFEAVVAASFEQSMEDSLAIVKRKGSVRTVILCQHENMLDYLLHAYILIEIYIYTYIDMYIEDKFKKIFCIYGR